MSSLDGARRELSDDDAFERGPAADLERFGLIRELVGRFAIITAVRSLGITDRLHIMTNTADSELARKKAAYAAHGAELVFTDGALERIALFAVLGETGARGLVPQLRRVLRDVDFRLPDLQREGGRRVTVTREVVDGKAEAELGDEVEEPVSLPVDLGGAPRGIVTGEMVDEGEAGDRTEAESLEERLALDDLTTEQRMYWEGTIMDELGRRPGATAYLLSEMQALGLRAHHIVAAAAKHQNLPPISLGVLLAYAVYLARVEAEGATRPDGASQFGPEPTGSSPPDSASLQGRLFFRPPSSIARHTPAPSGLTPDFPPEIFPEPLWRIPAPHVPPPRK